ncbi:MAG: NAD-dependent epimerase/dehydratase family protein [Gemmatimonadota bacterium]
MITGAAGTLGSVIRSHLEARGEYDLVLLDRDPKGDPEILQADLAVWKDDWTSLLRGAHAVLHLAAAAWAELPWAELDRDNVDVTLQVFEAAARGGVRRVVFASSNHVMEGYYDRGVPITPDLPPAPISPYGASKAAGERIARVYAERGGLSAVCLRIGMARDGPPPPTARLALQQRWLGYGDLCHGFERAIEAEGVRFAILNLVSDNRDSPWDLTETRRVLAYEPAEGCVPRHPPAWAGITRRLRRGADRFGGPRP